MTADLIWGYHGYGHFGHSLLKLSGRRVFPKYKSMNLCFKHMFTFAGRTRFASAVTLIEATVAMAILTIAMLGAMSYEFHATKNAQIAHAQTAATRTAQLLLEDWKSTGGSEEYNPTFLDLGFSSALNIPYDFDYDQSLGSPLNDAVYAVTINDVPMLVMLVWADVAHDTIAEIKLRKLAAIVECKAASEEAGYQWLENIEPVTLVTYARVDASGG